MWWPFRRKNIEQKPNIQALQVTPSFPERWSIPASKIRSDLKSILINDYDDNDNPIKRKLTTKEINRLIRHWKDTVRFAKGNFKGAFDIHIMRNRPYLRFVNFCGSGFCERLSNKIIKSDDPRAPQFYPPLFPGCRCTMTTHSQSELERDGYSEGWADIEPPDILAITTLPDWI